MKNGMTGNNQDIRNAIEKRGLKHYQVAAACGINRYTFSTWLSMELPPKKKRMIMNAICSLGEDNGDGICPVCGRPYED